MKNQACCTDKAPILGFGREIRGKNEECLMGEGGRDRVDTTYEFLAAFSSLRSYSSTLAHLIFMSPSFQRIVSTQMLLDVIPHSWN